MKYYVSYYNEYMIWYLFLSSLPNGTLLIMSSLSCTAFPTRLQARISRSRFLMGVRDFEDYAPQKIRIVTKTPSEMIREYHK